MHIFTYFSQSNRMEQRKTAKIPFICFVATLIAAVLCFSFGRNYNPYFLWFGLGFAGISLLSFMLTLTRFLRNRSIASGLLMTTTAATALYFVANRFISTAVPRAAANLSVASVNGAVNANGWFTPLFFAQIGLFALWFLIILFIIGVYVRPIKRIDHLLGQIIDAKQIKKMKLGKGRQYQAIADKLQILANEKYAATLKRQARQIQARNRAKVKKNVVNKIIQEQDKIPHPTN
jgi:signal transduction histidine kinase